MENLSQFAQIYQNFLYLWSRHCGRIFWNYSNFDVTVDISDPKLAHKYLTVSKYLPKFAQIWSVITSLGLDILKKIKYQSRSQFLASKISLYADVHSSAITFKGSRMRPQLPKYGLG